MLQKKNIFLFCYVTFGFVSVLSIKYPIVVSKTVTFSDPAPCVARDHTIFERTAWTFQNWHSPSRIKLVFRFFQLRVEIWQLKTWRILLLRINLIFLRCHVIQINVFRNLKPLGVLFFQHFNDGANSARFEIVYLNIVSSGTSLTFVRKNCNTSLQYISFYQHCICVPGIIMGIRH